jgi:hypothetical protein
MRKYAKSALFGRSVAHNQDRGRDRHSFRGVPPPLVGVSLHALAPDALLTEYEVASIGRWSTNTLTFWRRDLNHPLKWTRVYGGRIRYFAGDVKIFLASGAQPGRRCRAAL